MILAYLTHDEVNRDLAQHLADMLGVQLLPLFARDIAPLDAFDAIAYDLDSLTGDDRRLIVQALQRGRLFRPVAVHSYNLTPEDAARLRVADVAVYRRLNARVLVALREAALVHAAETADSVV
jgi:hypothetical protein